MFMEKRRQWHKKIQKNTYIRSSFVAFVCSLERVRCVIIAVALIHVQHLDVHGDGHSAPEKRLKNLSSNSRGCINGNSLCGQFPFVYGFQKILLFINALCPFLQDQTSKSLHTYEISFKKVIMSMLSHQIIFTRKYVVWFDCLIRT